MTNQPYIFVNDNPLNATDPLGRLGFNPCMGSRDPKARLACMKKVATTAKGSPSLVTLAKLAANSVMKHIGDIGTAVAIGVLFVPGLDVVDVAIVSTVALSSRVGQRTIVDGSSPWSSQNLGQNLADVFASAGGLWLVGVSSVGAEGVLSKMSTATANLVRLRLAFPDIFGLGLGQFKSSG